MAFNINQFRSALRYGGARTSLFQVQLTNPVTGIADLTFPFMCKSTELPASNLQQVPQFYFGRQVNFAANRTYDPWTAVVICDEDMIVRDAMEAWFAAINGPESNIRNLPSSAASDYKATALVTQYSQTGEELRTYKMIGLFPTNLGAVQLSWDQDQIQEFQVQFALDYWVIDGNTTGTGGNL